MNAEVNVTSYMRVNLGGSYRFVSGAKLAEITNEDIDGPSASLTLKFRGF